MSEMEENNVEIKKKSKKKKKKSKKIENNDESQDQEKNVDGEDPEEETEDGDVKTNSDGTEIKKTISKRKLKKLKHEELIKTQKLKSEANIQEKCLNYLSNWKYNKADWKFEKLRQIWLQNNMFDSVKIPEKFWPTLVEYFNSSKGRVRTQILEAATKIIESEEGEETIKSQRAREIVQNLQE